MTHSPAVLVVEDEVLIRMNVVDILEDLGFRCLEAANADQALELIETREDIGVLFTDIDMPGRIDGLQLAQAAASREPPIAVIVTSGHARTRTDGMPQGGIYIEKPYSRTDLASAVERLLGGD